MKLCIWDFLCNYSSRHAGICLCVWFKEEIGYYYKLSLAPLGPGTCPSCAGPRWGMYRGVGPLLPCLCRRVSPAPETALPFPVGHFGVL